jgi:uncharacterized protein
MEELPAGSGAIEGFRGRGFRVGGIDYPGGVVASAAGGVAWDATDLSALTEADLPSGELDLLIVGTGPTMRRVPPALVKAAAARGLAIEAMDSRAAARTYNMLLAEGRRVAAALLPL